MHKFIPAVTAALLVTTIVTATVSASPLKNYETGHAAIDIGGTFPTNLKFSDYWSHKKAASVYGGVTVGLGGNTAVNYKFNQYRTSGDEKITAQQLNLMYKVLPQVAVYAGYVNARTTVDERSRTSNSGQIGVQARVDIPLLFTVWGQAGVGNKMNSWEIGLSKPLLNNLDLNISYYDNKFKKLDQGGEAKAKGIHAGVTLKF